MHVTPSGMAAAVLLRGARGAVLRSIVSICMFISVEEISEVPLTVSDIGRLDRQSPPHSAWRAAAGARACAAAMSGGRTSVLVRNLPLDVHPNDVRHEFERYGRVRDVYLPRDFHSKRAKGFGFVEFLDERDAEEAIHHMDRKV